MTELTTNFAATQALTLLTGYGFELKGYPASILVYKWLNHYRPSWIRLAVVEALYQGRYKAISVEHILDCWLRRGQPHFHFSHEFERFICQSLATSATLGDNSRQNLPEQPPVTVPQLLAQTPAPEPVVQAAPTLPSLASEIATLSELREASAAVVPTVAQGSAIKEIVPTLLEEEGKETEHRRTIEQFTPLLDNSVLYSKLRAVAHQQLASKHPVTVNGQQLRINS